MTDGFLSSNNLAHLINLIKENRNEEAVSVLSDLLNQEPDSHLLLNLLGIANRGLENYEKAAEAFEAALKVDPRNADTLNNLSVTYIDMNNLNDALSLTEQASAVYPNDARLAYNRGNALAKSGQVIEGIQYFNRALEVKPDHVKAMNNLGASYYEMGDFEKAGRFYINALSVDPTNAEAILNKAKLDVLNGNFAVGFDGYEQRWSSTEFANSWKKSLKPAWQGQRDKTILIWAEQGIGDEIMFSSIIPDAAKISKHLIVQCDSRLIPIFTKSFEFKVDFVSSDDFISEEDYDFHIPIGSLARLFRRSLSSFQQVPSGHLTVCHKKVRELKNLISAPSDSPIVGVSWKTKATTQFSDKRNIELAELANLGRQTKITLISLQYGDTSREISAVETSLGVKVKHVEGLDLFNDIEGLAALIRCCDKVITIDNLNAHLAGALNVPTCLLLKVGHEWRWGLSQQSYWYDSISLIRQTQMDDWRACLLAASEEMRTTTT